MKSLSGFALFTLSVAFCGVAAETTNTFHVAEGETRTVDEIVAANGFTFKAGDWIRKTGKGQLNAVTTYKDVQLNLLIEEGVYYVPDSVGQYAHKGNSSLVVISGASLNIQGGMNYVFGGKWDVTFEGQGLGIGDNLGAICVGGNTQGPTLGDSASTSTFKMSGDATIYTYGSINTLFAGGTILNMANNVLTLRGKEYNAWFYPFNKLTVQNSGSIIVSNCHFLRQTGKDNVFSMPLRSVFFDATATMAPYNSPSIWDNVELFEFAFGAEISNSSYKGEKESTLPLKKIIGPVKICSPYPAIVTITDEYIVRSADLADGHYLTSEKEFIFAEGCKLSVADLEDFPKMDQASVYTVAVSSVSITGVPTLTGDAVNYFDIVKEDKVLALDCRKSRINAATGWGLKTGIENAAANTAAVADNLAAVGANTEVFIPSGEYWFSETLDLSGMTAEGLMLSGSDEGTVLHSGVAIGASKNVVVRNLVFEGCAGPAVVASGTEGLTVTECAISNVVGRYATAGRFIYAAVNVTDFNATGNTYWFDEMELDGQGYFEGGSQAAKSEAYAGAVVLDCSVIGFWSRWLNMTNVFGLADSAFAGKVLRKIGTGTFEPTDVNIAEKGFSGVEILDGRYVSRGDSWLGVPGGLVRVHDGGILQMRGTAAQNRTIRVMGVGYNSMGAIRFESGDAGKKSSAVTWILDGDTTVLSAQKGENILFNGETVYANGHTLTFDSAGGSGITNCINGPVDWHGGGTVKVVKSTLSSAAGAGAFNIVEGDAPKFIFAADAVYAPASDDISSLVKDCTFAEGAGIFPKNRTSVSFDCFSGFPETGENLVSIAINGTYSAKVADVLEGKYPEVSCALTFGPSAKWMLDEPAFLVAGTTYTLFKAAGGISRAPKTLPDDSNTAWRIHRANGGTVLCIGPRVGAVVVFR